MHPSSTSTDLCIQGTAQCAHVSSDFATVASHCGTLSLFNLNHTSTPRHVLKYLNPHSLTRIKSQRVSDTAILATLRNDGTLALWQPFASSLRPLLGVLSSPTVSAPLDAAGAFRDPSTVVTDMDFCSTNGNVIAGGCLSGEVHIYDTRVPFALQRTLGRSVCVSECVSGNSGSNSGNNSGSSSGSSSVSGSSACASGAVRSVAFSSCPYTLASCHDKQIMLWDLRSGGSSGAPMLSIAASSEESSFIDFSWSGPTSMSLVTVSVGGVSEQGSSGRPQYLQWWHALTGELQGRRDIPPIETNDDDSDDGTDRLSSSPLLLPTPTGRGVVVAQYLRPEAQAKVFAAQQTARPQSLPTPSQKALAALQTTPALSMHDKLRGMSSGAGCQDNVNGARSILSIYGFPRPDRTLSSIFEPPTGASTASKKYESGPSAQLCSSGASGASGMEGKAPVGICLAMKFGAPNRLVPSLQGGLELVSIYASVPSSNSSNSSICTLYAIALPSETVDKFSVDEGDTGTSVLTRPRGRYHKHNTIGNHKHHNHNHTVHKGGATLSLAGITAHANPPTYSVGGLHREWVRPSSVTPTSSSGSDSVGSSTPNIHPDDKIKQNNSTRLNSQSQPHQQRLGFWGQLQNEVLVLEEALQKGHLTGLALGRVDQYARQITLELSRPRSALTGGTFLLDDSGGDVVPLTALLIISFPVNFPSTKLFPTFTVRSLYEAMSTTDPSADALKESQQEMMFSLEAELAEVAKSTLLHSNRHASSLMASGLAEPSAGSSSGFILDVARCFWNRVQQVWCDIFAGKSGLKGTTSDIPTDGDVDSNVTGASKDRVTPNTPNKGDAVGTTSSPSKDRGVIDPKAYRVCSPVSSGGIFSCTGSLSLFGGSMIQLTQIAKNNNAAGGANDVDEVNSALHDGIDVSASGNASGEDSPNRKPVVKELKKHSSALIFPNRQFSFFPTTADVSKGGKGGGFLSADGSATNNHPKTYADLMLKRRELKLTYNNASRRERRRMEVAVGVRNVSGNAHEPGQSRSRRSGAPPLRRGSRGDEASNGAQHGGIRSGPYLAHFFGHGGLGTEDSNSDTISYDSDNDDNTLESRSGDSIEDEDEVPDSLTDPTLQTSSSSNAHNFFNSSLDELGAKLDRTQEENPDDSDESDDDDDDDDDVDFEDDEEEERKDTVESGKNVPGCGGGARQSALQVLIRNAFTSANPSSVSVCMYICGEKRYKLAKEYTFRAFVAQQPRGGSIVHRTLISRNKQHSSSDPDILEKKVLTHHNSEISPKRQMPIVSMSGKRVASMNNLAAAVVFDSPLREGSSSGEGLGRPRGPLQYSRSCDEDSPIQRPRAHSKDGATGYSSAVFAQSYYAEEQKQADKLSDMRADGRVVVDAHCVSLACATNSSLASTFQDHQLSRVWHLLSMSMKIMAITNFILYDPAEAPAPAHSVASRQRSQSQVSAQLDSCRIMVSCGVSKDWTVHSLGRPLFNRVFSHLRRVGDLQTLATLICTVGGPRVMALMLGDRTLYTSCSLDKILLRYADVLHRWQCHVHATEVSKFVSLHVFDVAPVTTTQGGSTTPMKSSGMGSSVSLLSTTDRHTSSSSLVSDLHTSLPPTPKPSYGPTTPVPVTRASASVFCFQVHCNQCGGEVGDDFWCRTCSNFAFRCSICEKVLRGSGFFCPSCGHGGHGDHIKQWFQTSPDCPIGCGCRCADFTFETFTPLLDGSTVEGGGSAVEGKYNTLFDESPPDEGHRPVRRLSGPSFLTDHSSNAGSSSTNKDGTVGF